MTAIKIFIDNTIYPVEIHKGQEVAFVFLPAGKQTAQGREQPVYRATLDNDTGRVINVTWQAKGMFNRLVTRHAPFLRRMLAKRTPTGSTTTSTVRSSSTARSVHE